MKDEKKYQAYMVDGPFKGSNYPVSKPNLQIIVGNGELNGERLGTAKYKLISNATDTPLRYQFVGPADNQP